MSITLGRLAATRKTGQERLVDGPADLGVDLSDFWGWSASDLVSNTLRGVVAEFIVARALGIDTSGVREEWATYDLRTPDGVTIEVKSSGYLQSWNQKRLSTISFGTKKTLASDGNTGGYGGLAKRHADVYVFALLAHSDKGTVNPLDVSQWRFHVLPAGALDALMPSQDSIGLNTLRKLAGPAVHFHDLASRLQEAS